MRLKGKVVIITGGGSGIGKETAILFAKEGAKVVVVDINEKGGEETVAVIRKISTDVLFIKVDVFNTKQVDNMATKTVNKFGKIDVLINNAGVVKDAFLTDITDEQIHRTIEVNQIGPIKCSRAVARMMLKQGWKGTIINNSSVVGLYGNKGQVVYSMTKAAIIGMTKTLAKELGPKGIRVNVVAPGFIETSMTASVPVEILEMIKEKTPLRMLGKPSDIAHAYLFLASDEAGYVNGSVFCIDGGLVI